MKRTPVGCPSCDAALTVTRLKCPDCSTEVAGDYAPAPLVRLSLEEQAFVEAFVLESGSLKAMAARLGVSYPTVRNRLNDIIRTLEVLA